MFRRDGRNGVVVNDAAVWGRRISRTAPGEEKRKRLLVVILVKDSCASCLWKRTVARKEKPSELAIYNTAPCFPKDWSDSRSTAPSSIFQVKGKKSPLYDSSSWQSGTLK